MDSKRGGALRGGSPISDEAPASNDANGCACEPGHGLADDGDAARWCKSPGIRFILKAAADGWVFEQVNAGFKASTGLSSAQIDGRTLQAVLPAGLAEALLSQGRGCIAARASSELVYAAPLPRGRSLCEITLTPLPKTLGGVDRLCGVVRELAERADGLEVHLLRPAGSALDQHPNLQFTAWPDGRPDYACPHLRAYTGVPRGGDLLAGVHPDDLARLSPSLPALGEQAAFETDVRLRRHDGAYRWFRVRAELAQGFSGHRWYGVAIDIEAMKARADEAADLAAPDNPLAGFAGCGVTLDRAARIVGATPQAARVFGLSEAQMIGRDGRELAPLPRLLVDTVEASIATGLPLLAEIPLGPPGSGRRWDFQVFPQGDGANLLFEEVDDGGLEREPRAARDAILIGRDAAQSEMALLDETGVIISANAAWRRAVDRLRPADAPFGMGVGIGQPYLDFLQSITPELVDETLRTGLRQILSRRSCDFVQAYVMAGPDGLRWRQVRIVPLPLASARFVAIHEDITDLERARAALRHKPHQLVWAQEQERQRIAIELHDSTAQHLVALGMGIRRLRRLAPATEEIGAALEEMSVSVRDAVKEIRVLSYLVKPRGLEQNGLEATVRQFVSGFAARSGLETTFDTSGGADCVAAPIQYAALRIVQEALLNAYRYAGSTRVAVELALQGKALAVRISDNGKGMPRQDGELAPESAGVGISNMRARVAQLGGALNIQSNPRGTRVEAIVPV